MERTKETLEARVRETPLLDRLKECRQRIGKMCSEGRPPRMCIPVQYDDDDFFICTTLADAQATVEALQRERDKLREATKVICGHCCEPMAIPSKAILQSQLSQLQGLVRGYFTEPDPHKWTAAYRALKRMGLTLDATTPERGQE